MVLVQEFAMSDKHVPRWCPCCAQITLHAPLPLLAAQGERIQALTQQVQGVWHRYYCTSCRGIWNAVEVPQQLLEELLVARRECRQLVHQLALLRLKLAQQPTPAPPSSQEPKAA